MLIRKTLSLADVSLKMDGESGKFAGYASKFGGVDLGGDTIVKGAFDYTLRTNGKPKMFLEHAPFTMSSGAAALPIGRWDVVKEDDVGLYVEGTLTPGLSIASDVHAALKHGTLDGLSIGGYVKKGDYDETENGRVIRRWTKLIEISAVTMPMDESARIDLSSVKSYEMLEAIDAIDSVRDFECFLRDAGGLSKGAAVALVARAKQVLAVEGEPSVGSVEAKHLALVAEKLRALVSVPASTT